MQITENSMGLAVFVFQEIPHQRGVFWGWVCGFFFFSFVGGRQSKKSLLLLTKA